MSDSTVVPTADNEGGDAADQATSTEPTGGGESARTTDTGDGTDWKAEARKWEQRAKRNRSEADGYKTRLDELGRARQAEEWRAAAAKEHGVPADVLRGSTREELEDHAKALAAAIKAAAPPAAPVVKNSGKTPTGAPNNEMRDFVRSLFGRND